MAAPTTSSPDGSDGNDALSAPSEFLAEFLSAIMRRQYAEALKFCRLILQYEPHNATARGFYPLLRHKAHAAARHAGASSGTGSSSSPPSSDRPYDHERSDSLSHSKQAGIFESGWSSGGSPRRSEDSASDLDLDLDVDPDSERSDLEPDADRELDPSSSARTSSGEGSGSGGARLLDDNGNNTVAALAPLTLTDDMENDNELTSYKGESPSLRKLRAQFACSIK